MFTVHHTDMYLRKSFRQLQHSLDPETVFFLGDLFDGGREWSTPPGEKDSRSTDKQWRKYGEAFWLREYYRFGRIFFKTWLGHTNNGQLRKIVAGLPGNHDLGLGMGIRLPVRKRFNAYFGSGNRIDLIGNHSFVSIDAVSLSAKAQPNGNMVDSGDRNPEDIWGPVEAFLADVKDEKARMTYRQVRSWQGKPENEPYDRQVYDLENDLDQLPKPPNREPMNTDIPSILLTHVPLYRTSGTPCGPLRERFPQSRNDAGALLDVDERNAIRVEAGVQYQNVLTPEISKELIEKIGDIEHVFSGDDHDYCEVVHRGYTSKNGGVREITVKSMSWAMGVRKPGFLMLSLWNPLDSNGKSIPIPSQSKSSFQTSTIQTHLCLLPDQLSILTTYAYLLALTLTAITISAIHSIYIHNPRQPSTIDTHNPLLPLANPPPSTNGHATHAASARLTHPSQAGLAARANASRARSASPFKGYALPPPRQQDVDADGKAHHKNKGLSSWGSGVGSATNGYKKDWVEEDLVGGRDRKYGLSAANGKGGGGLTEVGELVWRRLLRVAIGAGGWYLWLLWTS